MIFTAGWMTCTISIVAIENEWRSYRGQKKTFVCVKDIPGHAEPQTIALSLADFKDADGNTLTSWSQLDQLGLCASYEEKARGERPQPAQWNGNFPAFHRIEWRR